MRYVISDQRSVLVLVIQLIAYVVAAPVMEEMIFRGVIYGKLRKEFSAAVSVLITSVLFALIHDSGIQITYAFLMGAILCLLREQYGTVIAAMIFHMVFNLFGSGLVFSGFTDTWIGFGCVVFIVCSIWMIADGKRNAGMKE